MTAVLLGFGLRPLEVAGQVFGNGSRCHVIGLKQVGVPILDQRRPAEVGERYVSKRGTMNGSAFGWSCERLVSIR